MFFSQKDQAFGGSHVLFKRDCIPWMSLAINLNKWFASPAIFEVRLYHHLTGTVDF